MMQSSLEYIDQYFQGTPLPEEASAFEKRITEDPAFAEEVAFYLSARQALKEKLAEEKKSTFREIYAQNIPERILLKQKPAALPTHQYKTVLNGILTQQNDVGNYTDWKESGGRETQNADRLLY